MFGQYVANSVDHLVIMSTTEMEPSPTQIPVLCGKKSLPPYTGGRHSFIVNTFHLQDMMIGVYLAEMSFNRL